MCARRLTGVHDRTQEARTQRGALAAFAPIVVYGAVTLAFSPRRVRQSRRR